MRVTMPGRLGRSLLLCGFAAALPCVLPHAARAQMETREGIALQNQILELRRDLEALRAQRGGGGGDPVLRGPSRPSGDGGDIVPQLLDRVQSLEEEVRTLRGRLDQVENSTQRQYQDLTKQIGDLAFRVGNGAGGGGAPAAAPAPSLSPPPSTLGAVPEPGPAAPQPTGPVPRTPERAIQEGNAALGRNDYVAAEASAREVLQNNRTSPRAYDAQFLLAQALAGRRDYAQAAIAYDDAYNRSKTGGHAQDALLGLANALAAINEKRAACETLSKLAHEFPNQRPDVRGAAQTVRARAACN